jgi:hypothetical protein
MKSTTHENAPTDLPRAQLPQPANNARRNTAETDKSPRLGQVTVTTTQTRKSLDAWLSPENHNATGLDSINSQR